MRNYGLGFISDADIYNHVKSTVLQYRRSIDIKDFNKNIIDPIKMTFDAKIYGQTMRQAIEAECFRQIDKTNNNRIGYFRICLNMQAEAGAFLRTGHLVDLMSLMKNFTCMWR